MEVTVQDWLDSLAAKAPTPGGGAVAALSVAIAAAQLNMVTAYTTGTKWQDRETRMHELSENLVSLRVQALAVAKDDATAFSQLSAAYKLPRETESGKAARKSAIQGALAAAAKPPTKTAELAGQVVKIATELVESGNSNVISDVAVGASLARAALESAIVNIEINARDLEDPAVKGALRAAVEDATAFIKDAGAAVKAVREKLGNS